MLYISFFFRLVKECFAILEAWFGFYVDGKILKKKDHCTHMNLMIRLDPELG